MKTQNVDYQSTRIVDSLWTRANLSVGFNLIKISYHSNLAGLWRWIGQNSFVTYLVNNPHKYSYMKNTFCEICYPFKNRFSLLFGHAFNVNFQFNWGILWYENDLMVDFTFFLSDTLPLRHKTPINTFLRDITFDGYFCTY